MSELIQKDTMRYTQATRKLFEIMQARPDILEARFDRQRNDIQLHIKYNKDTEYEATLDSQAEELFKIMEGREEIEEVKFRYEDDVFEVIDTDGNIHLCLGHEFRGYWYGRKHGDEAYKLAKIARKMVHKKPLQMGKALLVKEEIELFNKEGLLRCQ